MHFDVQHIEQQDYHREYHFYKLHSHIDRKQLMRCILPTVVEHKNVIPSEDIKIQQHQLNRHIGKAGQYIRTNSVLCHITLWLTKQPLHEWQRSHRYGSEYAKTRWLLYD